MHMNSEFHHLAKKVMESAIAICLGILLMLTSFAGIADARKSLLSGDYENDTVLVAESLQEVIASSEDSSPNEAKDSETVTLIYEYISRYRPRGDVNTLVSFTTMQTALNSMAGHYKTFPNRPLPEKLKERLSQELTKAEKSLSSGN